MQKKQGFMLIEMVTNMVVVMIIAFFVVTFISFFSKSIKEFNDIQKKAEEESLIESLIFEYSCSHEIGDKLILVNDFEDWWLMNEDEVITLKYENASNSLTSLYLFPLNYITKITCQLKEGWLIYTIYYENNSYLLIIGGKDVYEERSLA